MGVDLNKNIIIAIFILQEALDIVHVSKEDQESVFAMLAAVLWLGNVSFTVIDNENHVEPVVDEGNGLLQGSTSTFYILFIIFVLAISLAGGSNIPNCWGDKSVKCFCSHIRSNINDQYYLL